MSRQYCKHAYLEMKLHCGDVIEICHMDAVNCDKK